MRQQMNVCVWVVLWNESARPWRFYTASGSELLKAAGAAWLKSQYAEMKQKKIHGDGKTLSRRDVLRGHGWACRPSSTKQFFHKANMHGTVRAAEVSIDWNSWTTKARSEWSEAGGPELSEAADVGGADCGFLSPRHSHEQYCNWKVTERTI